MNNTVYHACHVCGTPGPSSEWRADVGAVLCAECHLDAKRTPVLRMEPPEAALVTMTGLTLLG